MRIIEDRKLGFADVAILPKRSFINSRAEVNISRTFTSLYSKKTFQVCPIVAANLDSTGCFAVAKELSKFGMMTALHKFYPEEDLIRFSQNNSELVNNYIWYTLGIRDEDIDKFIRVQTIFPYSFVMIDVPNGYIQKFYDVVKRIRDLFPNVVLGAGNIVTAGAVEELVLRCGVEVIKGGIAGGNFCSTFETTGIFQPQLSTIIECSDAAHGLGALFISDGGCRTTGDVCKALCANADFVMLGSFLCGYDENDGEWVEENGVKMFRAYGMSSAVAINKYYGGYGLKTHRTSEGKVKLVEYKGSIENACHNIIGALKSCGSYIGAARLKDFSKCATFIKVN